MKLKTTAILNNQSGFSLMEVIVVALVMTILALNMTTLSKVEDAAAFRKQANNDMNEAIVEIGAILADPVNCRNFLTGTTLSIGSTTQLPGGSGGKNVTNKYYAAPDATYTKPDNSTVTYRDYLSVSEAWKFGNSKISIHSFEVSSWTGSNTILNSTAVLTVNFFRKNPYAWTPLTSMWVGKNINLFVTTNASQQITGCVAVNFVNLNFPSYPTNPAYTPNIANGIKACPTGMTMIGKPGRRETFCIESIRRATQASYHGAINTCANLNNSFFKFGSAHLCNFQEWSKACFQKNNLTDLYEDPTSTSLAIGDTANVWEWVSSPPTTNATQATQQNPSNAQASRVIKMGAVVAGSHSCLTADVSVYPYSDPQGALAVNCTSATNSFNSANTTFNSQLNTDCNAAVTDGTYSDYQACVDDINAAAATSLARFASGYTTNPDNPPINAGWYTTTLRTKWKDAYWTKVTCTGQANTSLYDCKNTLCAIADNSTASPYRCCYSNY